MKNMIIRELKQEEQPLLKDFLYEAIFQREQSNLLPRDVIKQPELSVFIDEFGKPDDHCLVVEYKGNVIGAVWTRILDGAVKGFGNLDHETPEFAISIYKPYRKQGIGTALMKEMLVMLKAKGYKRASLAVQKDNYAVKLYEAVGFHTMAELEEEFLMVCELHAEKARP